MAYKKGFYKKCDWCRVNDVYITPSRIKKNKRFCSRSCQGHGIISEGLSGMAGKKHSIKTRKKMSKSANGIIGALARWKGHIKEIKKYKYSRKKLKGISLEKKRFRNKRYKAIKRNASGSHTLVEWLLLKAFYNYMCLCCKRIEPEIKLTEDHIIPLRLGESDNIENIQPLCVSCNSRKYLKIINYRLIGGGEKVVSIAL